MSRIGLLSLCLVLFFMTGVHASEDAVTKAMKLFEKRHYDEAASVLRMDLATIEQSKQGTANLALGMIFFQNAILHHELYHSALAVSQDYLKKLATVPGQSRSRVADMYLGDALIEADKPAVAAMYFEKFLANRSIDPQQRSFAKICLGTAYYQNKEPDKGMALWSSIDASDPEANVELAAAYIRNGLTEKNPIGMTDESIDHMKHAGKQLTMRMMKNLLAVYSRARLTEKGLQLLKHMDLKAYSYREVLGRSKVIDFYDPSLLSDMSTLYGQASIGYLEKALADPKARDSAEFHLAQAYALFGSIDKSAKMTAQFITSSQMPQPYKDRIRVWQGADLYQKNNAIEAVGVWDELSRKQPEDPVLFAEILSTCGRLKIECAKIAKKSAVAVEAGEGKLFAPLNIALGKYFLGRMDYAKAVSYFEAGRDKGNKNKIEANDPAMLVSLSDAYYRTKKFSEALEIYFEMSKQFPEVRQIQEAMQGVYAVEHKSAGDVKIN